MGNPNNGAMITKKGIKELIFWTNSCPKNLKVWGIVRTRYGKLLGKRGYEKKFVLEKGRIGNC